MRTAVEEFGSALDEALPRMKPPRCTVFMNVTGAPVKPGTNPRDIAELLKRQLTSAVRWEESVRGMLRQGVVDFYEVGPGKQLKAVMKRIDQKAWEATTNVEM